MSQPRILVTGSDGQLARSLAGLKQTLHAEWVFTRKSDLDISDARAIQRYFADNRFDYCINTAAYTKVDQAETDEARARRLNETAPGVISTCCARQGCALFHFSTDYVYHNGLTRPLTEEDPCHPQSVYAHTKFGGEQLALATHPKTVVIRTSWVFSEYGHNFVKTMARLLLDGRPVRVVNDQIGCPTYAGDLAKAVIQIISRLETGHSQAPYGVYNYCNSGEITWYDFVLQIARELGVQAEITPVSTSDYGAAAPRPAYSVLETSKIRAAFELEIPHWHAGLIRVLREIPSPT